MYQGSTFSLFYPDDVSFCTQQNHNMVDILFQLICISVDLGLKLTYRGADKSLARPTSRCILFDGENISFVASIVICINSTHIPPIMIINRIYETQNILSL
jgi:hypothetical protein